MSFFWVPFKYSFATRIKKASTKVSFFITFFLPVFVLSYCSAISQVDFNHQVDFFMAFLLLFFALFLVYEIGYIYNDFHTTRFEKNPTIRLSLEEIKYFEKSYPIHVAIRLILALLFVFLANTYYEINVPSFLLLLSLLNLSYSLHNYYRGDENLLTIFLLLVFKYLSVPLAFVFEFNLNIFVNLFGFIFLFPLVRTIIFSTHDKISYDIMSKNNMTKFRLIYFFLSSMTLYLLSISNEIFSTLTYISIGFMLFYMLGFILERKNKL